MMDDQPLISVIVPVYKVEQYLDRCVASIVNQSYENLEIILVDDGSPDNCPAICDKWVEKDKRIRVVHQKNKGGAAARNTSLDIATGAYIGFVDSDDKIRKCFYEKLYYVIASTGVQIAECSYYCSESFEAESCKEMKVTVLDSMAALRENIHDRLCKHVVWDKLYSAEILKDIRFTEGRVMDDVFFTYKALGQAKSVAVIPDKLYFYRQQEDSIMHQAYSYKYLDAIDAKVEKLNYFLKDYLELVADAKYELMFSCLYHGQLALKSLHGTERNQILSYLRKVFATYQLNKMELKQLKPTHRLWLILCNMDFVFTCKLRNLLKIGS